ncbi:hypothetical protein [Kineosporia sp. NBRC 101731]|uniref:hypothetical protein n=1 Tax=Kineosporia sp. NBRC 101731 TaxID=3032199 RepID=UPI0024A5AAC4|nr:hypothetical protein [Kineosporia sp. NBRC 101731]GLY32499.1 hypothetical protein Kisp02_58640 [Kineosporia sp. NBRC 101731]
MPHQGERLGVDIARLYQAGQHKVIPLADEFREAASKLLKAPNTAVLLTRHEHLGGVRGPAQAPWEDLRDQLVEMLLTTATNMEDTGNAMLIAAEEYAKTDNVAAREYDRLKERYDKIEALEP